MCTLIVLHRLLPAHPLVVAANRDEYLDRPTEGPALRAGPGGPWVAPRDSRAGGTWWGINRHGVFVGLTNRRSGPPDPARRSRGLLVADLRDARSAAEAATRLEALLPGHYNPFNLLVADRGEAFLAAAREEEVKVHVLEPGVHVVGNGDPSDPSEPKEARQRSEVRRAAAAPTVAGALEALADVCRSHEAGDRDPLEATCIHAGGYGTRSSTLLALGAQGAPSVLRHAGGPPCTTPYTDFTHLLEAAAGSPAPSREPDQTRTER